MLWSVLENDWPVTFQTLQVIRIKKRRKLVPGWRRGRPNDWAHCLKPDRIFRNKQDGATGNIWTGVGRVSAEGALCAVLVPFL